MAEAGVCPLCGRAVSARALKCPSCGGRVRYRTTREAFSWTGLGVLDLIPGVRSLPDPVKLVLLVSIEGLNLLIVWWLISR